METNDILYIVGIGISFIFFTLSIWYFILRYKNKHLDTFKTKDTHLSKIIVKNFSTWVAVFTLFTAIVIFIFCVSMLAV